MVTINNLTMTVSDVQQAMNIGRNTAYELVNRADFPKIRMGRKIILPRDAFLRWLDQQTASEA